MGIIIVKVVFLNCLLSGWFWRVWLIICILCIVMCGCLGWLCGRLWYVGRCYMLVLKMLRFIIILLVGIVWNSFWSVWRMCMILCISVGVLILSSVWVLFVCEWNWRIFWVSCLCYLLVRIFYILILRELRSLLWEVVWSCVVGISFIVGLGMVVIWG